MTLKPKPKWQVEANNVRFVDSETLGRYIAEQTHGVLRRLAELRPLYEELWDRFAKLKKGETILDCRTRSEYARKILHRSMRSIQHALYGRRKTFVSIPKAIDDFVAEDFVVEEEEAAEAAQEEEWKKEREQRAAWRKAHPEEEAARQKRVEEAYREAQEAFRAAGNQRPTSLLKQPPASDIAEFANLGRREAARKYHPDNKGGDAARMASMNNVADWLEQMLGAA